MDPQYAYQSAPANTPFAPPLTPMMAGGGFLSRFVSDLKAAQQGSGPTYTYNPEDQSYTMTSPATSGSEGGLRGLLSRYMERRDASRPDSQPRYNFDPTTQSYTPMAVGGSVAAQQARSQGRGQDTMLVHMTPGEVKGLQALAMAHGGSLTINPQTGLPEAGFLSGILPMVLGGALTVMSGGALTPLMAAGIVGGGTALATGSLKKGLLAGLGAYGGAGIGSGLAGAGSAGAEAAGIEASRGEAMKQAAAMSQTAPLEASRAEAMRQAAAMQSLTESGIPLGPQAWNMQAIQQAGTMPANAAFDMAKIQQAGIAGKEAFAAQPWYERAGASIKAIPDQSLKTTAEQLGGYKGLSAAAMPVLSAMAKQPTLGGIAPQANLRPYEYSWNPQSQSYEPSPTPGDTSERLYFSPTYKALPIQRVAQGGQIVDPSDEMTQDGGYAAGGETGLGALAKKRKSLAGDDLYKFADSRRDQSMRASVEQNFAAGGLPPRFLSGGGDGMSDSIKANIDGKQEARLADGEFVVPADVVSHLGNGSSKAGAKKLYAMMDKIRKARTGRERQAPAVNAAKYMPA